MHSHLLPGLDDGPDTWEDSVRLAERLLAEGAREVVLTPHYHYRRFPNTRSVVAPVLGEFKRRLREASLGLQVYSGSEIHLTEHVPSLLEENVLPTINDGPYLLVELPFEGIPRGAAGLLDRIVGLGYRPILAHPERSAGIIAHPEWLGERVAGGVLGQVNAGSLLGEFGEPVRETAWRILAAGWVHVLGSDAHSLSNRPPLLARAAAEIAGRLGSERAARILEENPRAVLKGLALSSQEGNDVRS